MPIAVQILARADRRAVPYTTATAKFTLTLKLIPQTRIRETYYLAAEYAKLHLRAFVNHTRLEARDKDGSVFEESGTIGDELLEGEVLYLIEEGKTEKETSRERLRSLSVGSASRGRGGSAFRTPSASSRASSAAKGKAKSEPKKTPSQRALEIAQSHRQQKSEQRGRPLSRVARRRESSRSLRALSLEPEDTPKPSIEQAGEQNPPASADLSHSSPAKSKTRQNAAGEQEEVKDASATAVASQRSLPSPSSSPSLPAQDDELVVPDSQDPLNQPWERIKSLSDESAMAAIESTLKAAPPSSQLRGRPHTGPTTRADRSQTRHNKRDEVRQSAQKPQSKPDPYDINSALSDSGGLSPRRPSIMSTSVRKLGSSVKRPGLPSRPSPRRTLPIAKRQPSPIRDPTAATGRTTIPPTPDGRAATPCRGHAVPSSAPGPLLSSPTNHVAAALAKSQARTKRQPWPEYVLVEDSDDEFIDNVLQDAQDRFSSTQPQQPSFEAPLPWSAPPLRVSQEEDPFWPVRAVGRGSPSLDTSPVPKKRQVEQKPSVEDGVSKLGEPDRNAAAGNASSILKAEALPWCAIPPFDSSPPVETVIRSTPRSAPTSTPDKPPVVVIHGSSSSENLDEEIGHVDQVSQASPSQQAPNNDRQPSTAKPVEATFIHGTSSQDEADDEPRQPDTATALLFDDELLMNSLPAFPEDDEPNRSALVDSPPLDLTCESQAQLIATPRSPVQEYPQTDPLMAAADNETPPSAQVSKRKRQVSDEPNSEDERAKKRVRSEEDAEKAGKEERRKEKKARKKQQSREKRQRMVEENARQEEERKRLALEQAHRRAKELELVVSSPLKAAEMGLDISEEYESDDQESGSGQASSRVGRTGVPPPFERGDNNDSLSSKESEDRPSWRKLSKRLFSESPKSSPKSAEESGGEAGAAAPCASAPPGVAQQAGPVDQVEELPFQRRPFDDWAFLESTIGRGAHSSFEVHNRIHLKMMHTGLRNMATSGAKSMPGVTSRKVSKKVSKEASPEEQDIPIDRAPTQVPKVSVVGPPQQASSDDDDVHTLLRTDRSAAPSPKDTAVAAAQASKEKGTRRDIETQRAETQKRRVAKKARKKRRRQNKLTGTHKEIWRAYKNKGAAEAGRDD